MSQTIKILRSASNLPTTLAYGVPAVSFTGGGTKLFIGNNTNYASEITAEAGTLLGTVLNSTVVTSSLTALGNQSQALNMNSHQINNLSDPTSVQDAATKNYVDTINLTGDVTSVGKVTTIPGKTITNLMLNSMNNNTVKGNKSGTLTTPTDLVLSDITETDSSILTITNGANSVVSSSNLTVKLNLANTNIYVGNASNVPVAVAMSGDATLSNAGVLTLKNVGTASSTIGSATTSAIVSTDAQGRVTALTSILITPDANSLTGTTLSSSVVTSSLTTVGTIGTGTWQGTAITDAHISSSSNWNTAYTNRITSLTTTGSSGAATLSSNTLNIPTYTLAGLGGLSSTLAASNIFVGNGSNIATGVTMSGDTTIANTGAVTIATNVVSNAKFRQSAANSIVGNPTGSNANVQDITISTGLTTTSTTIKSISAFITDTFAYSYYGGL